MNPQDMNIPQDSHLFKQADPDIYISGDLLRLSDSYGFDMIGYQSIIVDEMEDNHYTLLAPYGDYIYRDGRLYRVPDIKKGKKVQEIRESWEVMNIEMAVNFVVHLELQIRSRHLEVLRDYPGRFNGRSIIRQTKSHEEVFADQIKTVFEDKALMGVTWAFKALAEYDRSFAIRSISSLKVDSSHNCDTDSFALIFGFDWEKTRDGSDYWSNIYFSVNQNKTLYKW